MAVKSSDSWLREMRPAAGTPDERLLAQPGDLDARPELAAVPYDSVDECGDASFPASDPPSWWSGR